MFDFKSAFKDSLLVATERFKKADADLRELVAAVTEALNATSGEALCLTLVDDDVYDGMIYKLVIEHKGSEDYYLPANMLAGEVAFRATVKGYPIDVGTFDDCHFESERTLENRGELEAYFAQLAASSQSPLVMRAAALLVQQERKKDEKPVAEQLKEYIAGPLKKQSTEDESDCLKMEDCVPF